MIQNPIKPCSREDVKLIVDAINAYNLDIVPQKVSEFWTSIELAIKDENQEVIGGILSSLGYWGGLEIKILWVKESHRDQGYGSQLLHKAEEIAKQKGASTAFLDTFDFQAPEFYRKNGYSVFGELDDFPSGHKRIFLSKKLT